MFIAGFLMFDVGLAISIPMFIILNTFKSYMYSYYRIDEETIAIIAILSVVMAIIGICLMLIGWIDSKNKALLNTVINQANANQNYCPMCNINVSANTKQCPICGRKFE